MKSENELSEEVIKVPSDMLQDKIDALNIKVTEQDKKIKELEHTVS